MDGFEDDDSRASSELSIEGEDVDNGLRIGISPPKRFKSCFIFFSMEKHKEIKAELCARGFPPKAANITKLVAEAWKDLPEKNKEKYQAMAAMDKLRYDEETAKYVNNGGTRRPSKRTRDPGAPKRPMSAFLAFANVRRAEVKAENPESTNGDISRLLGSKWRELPETIRQKYRDAELASWMSYREKMTEFRRKNDGRKKMNKCLGGTLQPRKRPKSRSFDEDSIGGNSFDYPTFPNGLGSLEATDATKHDDIMAASVALRGVRSAGSSHMFHLDGSGTQDGLHGGRASNAMSQGSDCLHAFEHRGTQNAAPTMSRTLNSLRAGTQHSVENSVNNGYIPVGFGHENDSNRTAVRALGLPVQHYSTYESVQNYANSQPDRVMQAFLGRGSYGGFRGEVSGIDQHPHLHSQPPPSMSMPTGMGGSLRQQDALYPTGIGGGVDLTLDRSLGRIGARLANVDASREKRMASSGGDLTYGHMKDRSDKRVG